MSKLSEAKRITRHMLEADPGRGGIIHCEGIRFDQETEREPHTCTKKFEMNETLIPRNVFQKMPDSEQAYFFSVVNCTIVCSTFHTKWGHSRVFREWYQEFARRYYGDAQVDQWLEKSPLKIKLFR